MRETENNKRYKAAMQGVGMQNVKMQQEAADKGSLQVNVTSSVKRQKAGPHRDLGLHLWAYLRCSEEGADNTQKRAAGICVICWQPNLSGTCTEMGKLHFFRGQAIHCRALSLHTAALHFSCARIGSRKRIK